MKIAKRMLTLALAVLMLMSIMTLPASAATADTAKSRMRSFTQLGEYNYQDYTELTKGLQRFLIANYITTGDMEGSGMDGIWGNRTRAAVRTLQDSLLPGTPDLIVGPNTWGAIASQLYEVANDASDGRVLLATRGSNNSRQMVYLVGDTSSTYYYYYYYNNGSYNDDYHFAAV